MFVWPSSNEIRHILSEDHSHRLDEQNPSAQFITDLLVEDVDVGDNALVNVSIVDHELFYIGANNSLWLRNASMAPGSYSIELHAKNDHYDTSKHLRIIIYDRNPLTLYLFGNMSRTFRKFPFLFIVASIVIAISLLSFLISYYLCIRSHTHKRMYGSRLIVNDEERSKHNSPRTKTASAVLLPSVHSSNYTVIGKQRKVSYATLFTS